MLLANIALALVGIAVVAGIRRRDALPSGGADHANAERHKCYPTAVSRERFPVLGATGCRGCD